MLFVTHITLLILLLFNNVYGQSGRWQPRLRSCDDLEYGGEWSLNLGLQLKRNMLNLFGYLEKKKVATLDSNIYGYFSNLKERLKRNTIDIFPLIHYIPDIYAAKRSSDRIFIAVKELEKAGTKQDCESKCTLDKWERSLDLKYLLDSLPKDLLLRGIPIKKRDHSGLAKFREIGSRFTWDLHPSNHSEEDLSKEFGQSILKIMRDIETNKFCFNESFFGHLLYFYPWPGYSVETQFALNRVARYFTRPATDFYVCDIVLKDVLTLIGSPWLILDHILNKMDTTECQPQLTMDIKQLLAARASSNANVNVDNLKGYGYLLNLLNILTHDVYPTEIILSRNRLFNYLQKVLPFLEQDEFFLYLFDTPEEKLYAFLHFLEQKRPFPIPCIKDSINAIEAQLYFRIGGGTKSPSTSLLRKILNAWSAPDLLDGIRFWATDLKMMIKENRAIFDKVLSENSRKRCMGLDACYAQIISLLHGNEQIRQYLHKFQPPPCLLQNVYSCGNGNKFTNTTDIGKLMQIIDYHKYPLSVIQAAERFLKVLGANFASLKPAPNSASCTKEELLVNILEANINNPQLALVSSNMQLIIASIRDKVKSAVPQATPMEISPLSRISNKVTIFNVINFLNSIKGMKFHVSQYEAATQLVKEDEEIINKRLSKANCTDVQDTASCLKQIMQVVEYKPPDVLLENNYALSFLLRPTVCDGTHCFWLPNEELESGPLNPVTHMLIRLLNKLDDKHENFNLKSDFEDIIKIIKTQDVKCALDQYQFYNNDYQTEQIIPFLRLLENCTDLRVSILKSIDNIINYLKFGTLPPTITIEDLRNIVHILIQQTTDPEVAQHIKENYQQLTLLETEVQDVLNTLHLDCATFEKCVSSLIMATKYSTDKIYLIIGEMVNPPECTLQTCPWLKYVTEESKTLEMILTKLVAIVNDSTTPLSVAFSVRRLIEYLRSAEGVAFVNRIQPIVLSSTEPVLVVLENLENESTTSLIKHDTKVLLNFLKFAAKPKSINVQDLLQLLQLLLAKTNGTAQNTVIQAINDVHSNQEYLNHILGKTNIDCAELGTCLIGIYRINEIPESLKKVIKIIMENYLDKTPPEERLNEIIQETMNMIRNESIPFHIRLDLMQILDMLKRADLISILTTVLKSLPQNVFLKLLENIPFGIMNSYNTVDNIEHITKYLVTGSLPSNLNVNTFHELAYILVNMTSDSNVKNSIISNLNVLEQMTTYPSKLSSLLVKCNTLSTCIDSIIRIIHFSENTDMVHQLIENILNPPACGRDTCPWTHTVGNELLVETVHNLRKELEEKLIASSSVPLIMKIYAKLLSKYITPDYVKLFPNAKTLYVLLDSFHRSHKFTKKVSDMSLSYIKYVDRSVIPDIMTHEDFIYLTEEMVNSTPDRAVKDEIITNGNVLQQYPVFLDSLLMACETRCITLKMCLASLQDCAKAQPQNPASTILLKYLNPRNCRRETCSWLGSSTSTYEVPFNILLNNTLREISFLEYNPNIPLHINLLLKQIELVIKTHKFEKFFKNAQSMTTLKEVFTTAMQKINEAVRDLLPANITNEYSSLAKLLQDMPVTALPKFGLFNVVANLAQYFELNEMPHYFDIRTVQELAKELTTRATATQVSLTVINESKKLSYLPDAEKWLSLLRVNCKTLTDCVQTLRKSLSTVLIPHEIYQTLLNIIEPTKCTEFNCSWLPATDNQIMRVINENKANLELIRASTDVPLIIKLTADQVLRYFTIENLGATIREHKITLEQLLEDMANGVANTPEVRRKAMTMWSFLKDRNSIPTELSYNDLLLLVEEVLNNTPDLFLKHQISDFGNMIYRHQQDFQTVLKQCSIICMNLRDCLGNLQICTNNAKSVVKKIVETGVNPPLCSTASCPWRPEAYNKTKRVIPIIRPAFVLAFLPTKQGNSSVLLNLNDYSVLTNLQRITAQAKPNPRNTFLIVKTSETDYVHLVLNLWDPKVQRSILKLSGSAEPRINVKNMDVLTILFPFSDERVRSFTLVLGKPEVRNKLLQLTDKKRAPGVPTIIVVDLDGRKHSLAINENDQLFFQELLSISFEGKRKTDQPSLILWPSQSGNWESLNIRGLRNNALVKIQNLPVITVVGYPSDVVQTSIGFLQLSFDVYDIRVIQILDSIHHVEGKPIIIINEDVTLSLTLPNELGKLRTAYIETTDEIVKKLETLSRAQVNVIEPTFTLKQNYKTIPIKMDPENADVRRFLEPYLSNTEGVEYILNKGILKIFREGLIKLLSDRTIPLNVQLEVLNIIEKLEPDEAIVVFSSMEQNIITKLKRLAKIIKKQVLDVSGSMPQTQILNFLETIPQETLVQLDIAQSANILLSFYRKGDIPMYLNVNSLTQLIKLVAKTANETVSQQLERLINEIQNTPTINIELSRLTLVCNTLQICVSSIGEAVKKLPKEKTIQRILEMLINIIETGKPIAPRSPLDELLMLAVIKMDVLSENQEIPFHIRMDMNQITTLWKDEKNRQRLVEVIANSPEGISKTITSNADRLLKAFLSGQVTNTSDIIVSTLKILPYSILRQFVIKENVKNVINYFERKIMPDVLTLNTLTQLVRTLIDDCKNSKIKVEMNQNMNTIQNSEDTDNVLPQLTVDCVSLESCVISLAKAVQHYPQQSNVVKLLMDILNPPGCTPEACSWTQQIIAENKSPTIKLLEETLSRMCALYQQPKIPNHIKWDINTVCSVLQNNDTKEGLNTVLESLPQSEIEEMNYKAQNLLLQLETETPPPLTQLIQVSLENLPTTYLHNLKILDNIRNIINYFQMGKLPENMDLTTFENLVITVLEDLQDQNVVVNVKNKLETLKTHQNVDEVLERIPVECKNSAVCLQTLIESLRTSPDQGQVVQLLLSIVSDLLNALQQQTDKNVKEIVVLPVRDRIPHVILEISKPIVRKILHDITRVTKPKYPTVIFNVLNQRSIPKMIIFDGKDPMTVQLLKQLQETTIQPLLPTKIETQNGKYIIGTLPTDDGLKYFLIRDDDQTFTKLRAVASPQGPNTWQLPFSRGTVSLLLQNILEESLNNPVNQVIYLPPRCDLQPEYIPLPNGMFTKPDWKQIHNSRNQTFGTIVPIVEADCSNTLINVNLFELQTQSQGKISFIQPDDKSIVVLSVVDSNGKVHHLILDLSNQEVLNELKTMTEKVNRSSDSLYVINYVGPDGTVTKIIFDLNNPDLELLYKLSQKTSTDLAPIYIENAESNTAVLAIVVATADGKKHNIVLNVSDANVISQLKKLSDPTKPYTTILEIRDADGRIIRLYIDKNDINTIEKLIKISQQNQVIHPPLVNGESHDGINYIVTQDLLHGKTTYVLDTKNPVVVETLERLSKEAPSNAPLVQIIYPDGIIRYIRLEINNPKVTEILKTLALKVVVERNDNNLIVFKVENGHPIVLDVTVDKIVETLKNMSTWGNPNSNNIHVLTFTDKFGNTVIVKLDMNDQKTVETLLYLQQFTDVHLEPIQVTTRNGSIGAVVLVKDENGKTISLFIDSSDAAIEKLLPYSNKLNPNATKITVTNSNNEIVNLYLDLTDPRVIQVLKEVSAASHVKLNISTISQTAHQTIVVPIVKNGQTSAVKCNISDEQTVKIIFELTKLRGPNPVIYQTQIVDFSGNSRAIVLDTSLAKVVNELEKICVTPPTPEDILIIGVKNDQNQTITFLLNTKDPIVLSKLKQLSNSTLPGDPNAVDIRVIDADGKIITLHLNLNDPFVLDILQQLHDRTVENINSGTLLPDGNGKMTLLVLKVVGEDGKTRTIVLDINNKETLEMLRKYSNETSMVTVPIQLITANGIITVYIDVKDTGFVKEATTLSQNRETGTINIIQLQYNETDILSLPLIAEGHSVTVQLNLRDPRVRDIIIQHQGKQGPNSHYVHIKGEDGLMHRYWIDLTDSELARKLMNASDGYEFVIEEQTLMIVPMVRKGRPPEFVVLDLRNNIVTERLDEIAKLGDDNNKVSFQYIDHYGTTKLVYLDLDDESVRNQLKELEKYTPGWIKPIETTHPNTVYLITSFLDPQGNVQTVVLDINNSTIMEQLKSLERPNPRRPLVLKYTTPDGDEATIKLDVSVADVINALKYLSAPLDSYPKEIFTNRPVISTLIEPKLVIPVDLSDGRTVNYIFDSSDSEVFSNLVSLASAPDVKSRIIYMQDPTGRTTAIRIDTSDQEVISKLAEYSQDTTVSANPHSLLTLTVPNSEYSSDVIILDVSNQEVVQSLGQFGETAPVQNAVTSLFVLTDNNGVYYPVILNLNNQGVIQRLKELQEKTPKKIMPLFVIVDGKQKPFVIFTLEDKNHNVLPIVLDLNNDYVQSYLQTLPTSASKNAFSFDIFDNRNIRRKIFIDTDDYVVQNKLRELSKLTPNLPNGIVTVAPDQLIVIPLILDSGEIVTITLDPKDPETAQSLRQLAEIPMNPGTGLVLNLNENGVTRPIRLDTSNAQVIQVLKQLGKKLQMANVFPVTTLGDVQLISFLLKKLNVNNKDSVEIITIDLNNPNVVEQVNQLIRDSNGPHLVIPMGKKKIQISVDTSNPTVVSILENISKLVPISLVPTKVVSPSKKLSLVGFIISNDKRSEVVTLDLEDDNVFDQLKYFNIERNQNTVTFLFNTPIAGKENVTLDVTDSMVKDKLRSLTATLPVRIIPIESRRPIIGVSFENNIREVINLDVGNPVVVRSLTRLSNSMDSGQSTRYIIETETEESLTTYIRIGLKDHLIQQQLREVGKKTRLPSVKIFDTRRGEQEFEVRILLPGTMLPLILIEIGRELIALDPNAYHVMSKLQEFSRYPTPQSTVIHLSSVEGNIEKLRLNLNDPRVITELKKLSKLSPLKVEDSSKRIPIIHVNIPDRNGKKRFVALDFNDPKVWNAFNNLGKKIYARPSLIQLPVNKDFKIFAVDFNNMQVIDAINRIATDVGGKHFYNKFQIKDPFGTTWTILLDTENPQVLRELEERSKKTPKDIASLLQLKRANNDTIQFYLNLKDISTVNLLKRLHFVSTNQNATSEITKAPKYIRFTIETPDGKTHQIKLDVNNDSVMKKVIQLSKWFEGNSKTVVQIPVNGKNILLELDVTNEKTIENLLNLQNESKGGKGVPLIPIGNNGGIKQTMLVNFNITSPHYGNLTITFDLFLPGMIDKLKNLSNSITNQGGSETHIEIDDRHGTKFTLRLDLNNQATVETLASLTMLSTGNNPIKGPPKVIHLAQYLTLEIPYSVERIYITFDKSIEIVNQQLLALNDTASGNATKFEYEHDKQFISLDIFNRKIVKKLQTISTPTVPVTVEPKVSIHTLIYLASRDGNVLPLQIDLGDKIDVISIIRLSQKYQRSMKSPSYLEVRDDTGQYLRVPLDFNDPDVVQELRSRYLSKQIIQIDARMMPYLQLVVPSSSLQEGTQYYVLDFQLKPKNIKLLQNIVKENDGLPMMDIVDALNVRHNFSFAPRFNSLTHMVKYLEGAVEGGPRIVTNGFIIYAVDMDSQPKPIYLDLRDRDTIEAIKMLPYNINFPLTVLQHLDEYNQLSYNFVNLLDPSARDVLAKYTNNIADHTIQRTEKVEKAVVHLSYGPKTITIHLNMADPKVVNELKEISKLAGPGSSRLELEDAQGFPIILKIDYSNKNVIARLVALNSP